MMLQLNGSPQKSHECIFRHPATQNLGWQDARSMRVARVETAAEPRASKIKPSLSSQSRTAR